MTVSCKSILPVFFCIFALSLMLSLSPALAGPVTWPEPLSFSNSVVVVTTSASSIGKTDTTVTLYVLEGSENNPVNLFDSADPKALNSNAVCYTGTMHTRGQSTSGLPKHQYAVKVEDVCCKKSGCSWAQPTGNFMGMNYGGKHWVFGAPWYDKTMIRNVMAFEMQRTLGDNTGSNAWAPRTKYFELFIVTNFTDAAGPSVSQVLNGYTGVHINTEHVRAESHRVPIPDTYAPVADGAVGGVLLQINNQEPGDTSKKVLAQGNICNTNNTMVAQWPESDYFDAHPDQFTAVQNGYYNSSLSPDFSGWAYMFNSTATGGCISQPATVMPDQCLGGIAEDAYWTMVENYTELGSFAEYFLLNELAKDPDGYHRSTFMYRAADTKPDAAVIPGKVYAGPLWDKNKSYKNTNLHRQEFYYETSGWLFTFQTCSQAPWWWTVLSQYTPFTEEISKVWSESSDDKTGAFGYTRISEQVAKYKKDLTDSGAYVRDYQRYFGSGNSANDKTTALAQLDSEVTTMLAYIKDRLIWMGSNIDKVKDAVGSDCSQ